MELGKIILALNIRHRTDRPRMETRSMIGEDYRNVEHEIVGLPFVSFDNLMQIYKHLTSEKPPWALYGARFLADYYDRM
jgi:hypothetical protein